MREALALFISLSLLLAGLAALWRQWWGEEALTPFLWASSVCVSCGVLALLAQEGAFRLGADWAGTMGSILIRTLGPLAMAVILSRQSPQMVEHQFFPAFVSCYLLTLLLETILSVRLVNRWEKRRTSH